ncbi:hypothetical protein G6O69_22925 [Pseudenhygromyxa sp. WMMC2535]|uniref:hypothetical protein n=1 Tax=Pseudenhygromyxa sp. WMMC2535 TaxID=2712867 RepID=UPI0015570C63|nr:hypothetical protein [Pseudenhygromyxa sp. WMMC2535]NVB40711.1 hypothetical protein [Pseudenhygromyxa sp. WMMC2535]
MSGADVGAEEQAKHARQLRKVAVGGWRIESTRDDGTLTRYIHLRPDFSLLSTGSLERADKTLPYFEKGAWAVSGSQLTIVLTDCSEAERLGVPEVFEVESATLGALSLRDASGATLEMTSEDPVSDDEIRDIFSGFWYVETTVVGDVWKFVTQFTVEGEYNASGYRLVEGEPQPIQDLGGWRISAGKLLYVMLDATRAEDQNLKVSNQIIHVEGDYAIIAAKSGNWNEMARVEGPGDERLREGIVGRWKGEDTTATEKYDFVQTFTAEGAWTLEGTGKTRADEDFSLRYSGRYTIANGMVVKTIAESSDPERVGDALSCPVVYLDDYMIAEVWEGRLATSIPVT